MLDGLFYTCLLGALVWSELVKSFVSLFSLDIVSIIESGGIEVLYYYCVVISPSSSVNGCFTYWGTLMLGAYIFMIFVYSWWNEPFVNM